MGKIEYFSFGIKLDILIKKTILEKLPFYSSFFLALPPKPNKKII